MCGGQFYRWTVSGRVHPTSKADIGPETRRLLGRAPPRQAGSWRCSSPLPWSLATRGGSGTGAGVPSLSDLLDPRLDRRHSPTAQHPYVWDAVGVEGGDGAERGRAGPGHDCGQWSRSAAARAGRSSIRPARCSWRRRGAEAAVAPVVHGPGWIRSRRSSALRDLAMTPRRSGVDPVNASWPARASPWRRQYAIGAALPAATAAAGEYLVRGSRSRCGRRR